MSRINWDYAVGVVMGAVMTMACKKLYDLGIEEGINRSLRTMELLAKREEKSVETDKVES